MEQLRQWPPLSMQGTDTEPPQDLHKQAPEETGGWGQDLEDTEEPT